MSTPTQINSTENNWKEFFDEISWKWFFKCLSTIAIFFIFYNPIQPFLNEYPIKYLLRHIPVAVLRTDVIFISIAIYGLVYAIIYLNKGLILTINSLFMILTVLIIYWICFRYSPD